MCVIVDIQATTCVCYSRQTTCVSVIVDIQAFHYVSVIVDIHSTMCDCYSRRSLRVYLL